MVLLFFVIIIFIPHEDSNAQTSEDIALETFYNSDYGVSIKYPQNWYVDDEVIEWDPLPEFDDGSVSVVLFSNSPDFSGLSIDLTLYKNDVFAQNYQDDDYIQQITQHLKSFCVDDVEIGYKCRNHSITNSQILSIDGHKAYQYIERYSDAFDNEELSQSVRIITDIIYGTDVWSISALSFESDYQFLASVMEKIVYTFDFDESVLAFAQEMGFYQNEKFEFSFEAPTDWNYQEGVTITEGRIDEVVLFPSEFHVSNAGDDANFMDMQTAMMGWEWQFESPVIGMDYENIPTSKIKTLNENSIKEFYLDFVREQVPSAKMKDIYSKSHSWGWEVGVTYFFDFSLGFGPPIPYVGIDKAFFFKDREKYTLYYGAPEVYFDNYKWVYDHAVDTMTIKSHKVPEFHEIAIMVLGSGIIGIIAISKKFKILNS